MPVKRSQDQDHRVGLPYMGAHGGHVLQIGIGIGMRTAVAMIRMANIFFPCSGEPGN